MKTLCHLRVYFLILAVGWAVSSSASAQTTWGNGTGSGVWNTASNWDNGVPDVDTQARFLDGSLPDAPIVVTIGAGMTPVRNLNFATSANRTVTIQGETLLLRGNATNGAAKWNNSFDSTNLITINSDVNYEASTANTTFQFTIDVGAPIIFNGNITVSGDGTRPMGISAKGVVTINGRNEATWLNFGGTGEFIAGSTSALGMGGVQKTGNTTLSLRSDVTLTGNGGGYSWYQYGTSSGIRISEENPGGTTDRTLTMNSRVISHNSANLTFLSNINSTGHLILELKYSGGNSQSLDLITNDTAIVRFAQTGSTTYSGVISGNGSLEKTAAGTTTLSAANTYTGNTSITAGTLILSSTGKLNFKIGADGVNNQITGGAGGTLTLNGTLTFDLTDAGTTLGDSWNIVDLDKLGTVNFGTAFAIENFTANGSLWTRTYNGAQYEFSETTGILSVIPEPTTGLLLGGAALTLTLLRTRRRRG